MAKSIISVASVIYIFNNYYAADKNNTDKPLSPAQKHRWELPGSYPVFTMLMVIYHYVDIIWRILVTPNFVYNINKHE